MEVTCANGHAVDVTGPAVRFCRLCGAPLPRRCPNDHPVSDRAKFCGMCGASVVAPVAPPTGILTSGADRPTTAPTVVDAARRPTDATTYQAPTHHEPTQPGPSGPTGPLAGSAATPIPPPPAVYVRSPRPRWLLPTVLGGVAAVAVAIVLVLLLTRSGRGPAAAGRQPTGSAVRQSSHQTSTTVPPTTTATTTTTTGVGQQQAQALSNLLTQSAAQRSGVVAAVAEIGTCGNLNAAQFDPARGGGRAPDPARPVGRAPAPHSAERQPVPAAAEFRPGRARRAPTTPIPSGRRTRWITRQAACPAIIRTPISRRPRRPTSRPIRPSRASSTCGTRSPPSTGCRRGRLISSDGRPCRAASAAADRRRPRGGCRTGGAGGGHDRRAHPVRQP